LPFRDFCKPVDSLAAVAARWVNDEVCRSHGQGRRPSGQSNTAIKMAASDSQNVMRKVPTKLFCVTGFGVTAIW
jgi:hypothetical protein